MKNVVAVPLDKKEIEDMNLPSLHKLKFDRDDSMHILNSFAKLMFPKNSDEWLEKKFNNFIEAYCDFMQTLPEKLQILLCYS